MAGPAVRLLLATFLILTLTRPVFGGTLETLTGADWLRWTFEDQKFFVAGYVLALKATEEVLWMDSLPESVEPVFAGTLREIVESVTAFYRSGLAPDFPLYRAVLLWQTWRFIQWP